MVKDMRKKDMQNGRKKNKKGSSLTPYLFILNVVLWGSAFYLWSRNADEPPQIMDDFATAFAEIHIPTISEPVIVEPVVFRDSQVLTYEDVDFHLYSNHALLVNLDTNEILFDHRGSERAYPASVTKIMTVLVGIEHATSDELVVYADFDALFQANAAMAGFANGETRTLSEVLYASMLPSGADATSTLAYHVAGSYQGFVDLMNETAQRLGMYDTHFMNASGLHDDNHYTTAYDTALLVRYALNNRFFREIFTAPTYSFINSAGNEEVMESTMFRNMSTPMFNGGEILGGKTGFTTPAGLCLASIATDGVHEFALITFAAHSDGSTSIPNIRDAFTTYEYFFNLANNSSE